MLSRSVYFEGKSSSLMQQESLFTIRILIKGC